MGSKCAVENLGQANTSTPALSPPSVVRPSSRVDKTLFTHGSASLSAAEG